MAPGEPVSATYVKGEQSMLTPLITLGQVLDSPAGRAVLDRYLPGVADAPVEWHSQLIGAFLRVTPVLRDDVDARDAFWAEIDEVMTPVLLDNHPGPVPSAGSRVPGPRSS